MEAPPGGLEWVGGDVRPRRPQESAARSKLVVLMRSFRPGCHGLAPNPCETAAAHGLGTNPWHPKGSATTI